MRYLLITYVRKPNGQIDEQVTVSKRAKTSDIQTCNVILDYAKRKINKCVIEGKTVDTDWEKMNEYYRKVYPSLITQLENSNTEAVKTDK
jgi:hypothetical protein